MKRHKFFMTLVLAAILLVFILPTGCAKKVVTKEQAVEKQAPAQPAETAMEKESEEALAKERAKERAAEEQLAREKAGEEAAAAEEAAKVAREASEFEDIHFDFDRFDLRPDARGILDTHAKWLKAHPEYVVRIEGNCDERGTVEYNLALGDRRAKIAMKYLTDLGINKAKISTISYGKEQPLDPEHNEEAWAKNRRDHFIVTKGK
ncbi:MAG TPA: peptidoglycan-associated lipoprotein Pal [Syntrophales bacterium]|nr:peptidoglycan-associated lipoprotein Pal [Syntrophales bacterium]